MEKTLRQLFPLSSSSVCTVVCVSAHLLIPPLDERVHPTFIQGGSGLESCLCL